MDQSATRGDGRSIAFWTLLAVLAGGVGLVLSSGAFVRGSWLLASAGAVHLAISAYSLRAWIGAQSPNANRLEARPRQPRAQLALLVLAAPYAVAMLSASLIYAGPPSRVVSGKPVEVRRFSKQVVMPGGQAFYFSCGRRRLRLCEGEKQWAKLPRWPQPEHVRMQVSGSQIRSLIMDDVVVVDIAETLKRERTSRLIGLLAGLGATIAVIIGIASRVRLIARNIA